MVSAVIVDPYSAGARLPRELHARGLDVVAVLSTLDSPKSFRSSFEPSDFSQCIQHDGDLDRTVELVRLHSPRCIIAGCELGVTLSDLLSSRLQLPSNDAESTAARRDKAAMGKLVAQRGLAVPDQSCFDSAEEAVEWADNKLRWPIVVKPRSSCGSDGVSLCRTPSDVKSNFQALLGRRNMLGLVDDSLLVQAFVDGVEYIVDAVSCDGRHRRAGFWRYMKPTADAYVGYNAMLLLPLHGELQDRLFAFATAALDAVGIRQGASHSELILTDDGPVFLEVGARMNGGINSELGRICGGPCPLDLNVLAYVDRDSFDSTADDAVEYSATAANYFLIPGRSGILRGVPRMAEVKRLRSHYMTSGSMKLGVPVNRTVGVVTLVHRDRDVVESDLRALSELERSDFYEIDDGDI